MINWLVNKFLNWQKPIYIENDSYEVDVESIKIPSKTSVINTISAVNVINTGSGYTSMPMTLPNAAPNVYSFSVHTTNKPVDTAIFGELVIHINDKQTIRVAETLSEILNQFEIIIPNQDLINKYPSLKIAWDDYQNEFRKSFFPEKLKDAINNYKTTEKLVKD